MTGANTDLANSDGLKLAREVDPEGLRTIGVLTKVDLVFLFIIFIDGPRNRRCRYFVRKSNSVTTWYLLDLNKGYVPVVNRGQRDIDSRKTIKKALLSETEFFENHLSYRSKAQYCGTPFLSKRLNLVP